MSRRAKIICTIGPASESEDRLRSLIKAGMDIARLNFSHGTHAEHLEKIKRIRKVASELDKPVAILQDLQGPKIRIGKFGNPPVTLKPGDRFTITTDKVLGNEQRVSTSYKNLPADVKVDDIILVNDGLIKLKVEQVDSNNIHCRIINGGSLYDRRGINLPGVRISEPSLTAKDKEDLQFGLEHGIDLAALSFVRDAESIADLKNFIGDKNIPVIAKLEKPQALNNLDAIVQAADGIMVARGDLGVEINAEKVPVVQKQIIEKCLHYNKPVITATQMLDSMMTNPIPTRAEVTDVANAIYDGSDAVMLSGETAFGKYPVKTVEMMHAIVEESETHEKYFRLKPDDAYKNKAISFTHSVCHSAYHCSEETRARYIIVFSKSGYTARIMSVFRPRAPILALTDNKNTLFQMMLNWGIIPLLLDKNICVTGELSDLISFLRSHNKIKEGDRLVIVAGSTNEKGGTNLLRLHKV